MIGLDPDFGTGWGIDSSSPAATSGSPYDGLRGDITGACFADPPSIGAYQAIE